MQFPRPGLVLASASIQPRSEGVQDTRLLAGDPTTSEARSGARIGMGIMLASCFVLRNLRKISQMEMAVSLTRYIGSWNYVQRSPGWDGSCCTTDGAVSTAGNLEVQSSKDEYFS